MFILNSDIPRELYNKLTIVEEDLDTLTMCADSEITHFTQYEGKAYIVTNTWEELNIFTRDTGITLRTSNSSYLPYTTLNFVDEKD